MTSGRVASSRPPGQEASRPADAHRQGSCGTWHPSAAARLASPLGGDTHPTRSATGSSADAQDQNVDGREHTGECWASLRGASPPGRCLAGARGRAPTPESAHTIHHPSVALGERPPTGLPAGTCHCCLSQRLQDDGQSPSAGLKLSSLRILCTAQLCPHGPGLSPKTQLSSAWPPWA